MMLKYLLILVVLCVVYVESAATPSPTSSPTPSPSPSPLPSPPPCNFNAQCEIGQFCFNMFCQNLDCPIVNDAILDQIKNTEEWDYVSATATNLFDVPGFFKDDDDTDGEDCLVKVLIAGEEINASLGDIIQLAAATITEVTIVNTNFSTLVDDEQDYCDPTFPFVNPGNVLLSDNDEDRCRPCTTACTEIGQTCINETCDYFPCEVVNELIVNAIRGVWGNVPASTLTLDEISGFSFDGNNCLQKVEFANANINAPLPNELLYAANTLTKINITESGVSDVIFNQDFCDPAFPQMSPGDVLIVEDDVDFCNPDLSCSQVNDIILAAIQRDWPSFCPSSTNLCHVQGFNCYNKPNSEKDGCLKKIKLKNAGLDGPLPTEILLSFDQHLKRLKVIKSNLDTPVDPAFCDCANHNVRIALRQNGQDLCNGQCNDPSSSSMSSYGWC